jgi:phage-related protein
VDSRAKKIRRFVKQFNDLLNKFDTDTLVISTHGIIKKTDKIPKSEIDKAEKLRIEYFNAK